MRALIVDDSAFDLGLLAHQLGVLGFADVTSVQQASDALALLAEGGEPFDVVVCDLRMPGIDGIEFLRSLAATPFTSQLVLVSGEDASVLRAAERLARARGLRVLGSLPKPVATVALRNLLARRGGGVTTRARDDHPTYGPDDLRRAIAEHQVVCYCQPQVRLDTGSLAGVEMLARWHHPSDGLVLPDRFVPTAEAHGLIGDLTSAVLGEALAHARRWRRAGLDHTVAVNVSMVDLTRADLPDDVEAALMQVDVPADGLVLEVTESRLLQDIRTPLDVLIRLRLKHVGLSIDDFGTGHASLAQLRDMPFTELKIDRGFVHGAHRDASRAAILEASLDMAQSLGLRSVAEGIEDADDWSYLRARGCDVAQGYFIARPMPPQDLTKWLSGWEGRLRELALCEP